MARELTISNFGLFIGYVLPGFTALGGLPFLAGATGWGTAADGSDPSITEFLSGTVEAVATGLTVSTVRWLVVDTIHHRTGLRPPRWDFRVLDEAADAFELLIQIHYHYYKFYANMVVALVWAYLAGGYAYGWRGLWYGVLAALFFVASRDTLMKYYERSGRLLSSSS
ncbi:hypothetical protein GobsT_25510 [Gemmata obscuriglobus]|uniref:Uncharacterized protein n=1 Tax=Gemmata obscuriglobus TaxID=114 RepID=A0A2Z3H845_9BACT|nr:hypothetical protein [Gemmata obscuriglobus]AWM39165.1 hypothetical protein C1280_20700 [Gemmata obscuriglobus]QEG27787.1 hypothetical protein GobsT_25510 [Gemmata obscuriglobus]VTS05100.1 unnamed protein product [Gemmata obscuriglobus UQM 2246]